MTIFEILQWTADYLLVLELEDVDEVLGWFRLFQMFTISSVKSQSIIVPVLCLITDVIYSKIQWQYTHHFHTSLRSDCSLRYSNNHKPNCVRYSSCSICFIPQKSMGKSPQNLPAVYLFIVWVLNGLCAAVQYFKCGLISDSYNAIYLSEALWSYSRKTKTFKHLDPDAFILFITR